MAFSFDDSMCVNSTAGNQCVGLQNLLECNQLLSLSREDMLKDAVLGFINKLRAAGFSDSEINSASHRISNVISMSPIKR
jgi:hypothetical protein